MDLILKAWGQENSTPFTRWEVKRNASVIIFKQEEYPRTIGVRVGEIERVKINWRNTFETPCPPEIEGKPIIFIGPVRFGFENNGTEIFLYWMEKNSEQELLFEFTGGDHIIRHIQVSKDEILSGNIGRVKSLVAMISHELRLDQKVHPWNLTISGYDYDPRPLSEIPEVVIWYKKVHEEISYLPIFLTPFALNPYLLSVLDAKMQFSKKNGTFKCRNKGYQGHGIYCMFQD